MSKVLSGPFFRDALYIKIQNMIFLIFCENIMIFSNPVLGERCYVTFALCHEPSVCRLLSVCNVVAQCTLPRGLNFLAIFLHQLN